MAMFFPHKCTTPTLPKEREKDPFIDPTKYDNWRPGSVLSFSTYSRGRDRSTASISALQTHEEAASKRSTVISLGMLAGRARLDSCASLASRTPSMVDLEAKGPLGKLKYYYDAYGGRQVSSVILLIIYSLLGATMFYFVEHEHENELKRIEDEDVGVMRNRTLELLNFTGNKMDALKILANFEDDVRKRRMMEGMPWDWWGALFYVGTLYTTIGYGNIFPRSRLGRGLSIIYAIVGIPLVLAILSQWGRSLTNGLSEWWQRRQFLRLKKSKEERDLKAMEEGKRASSVTSDEEELESRTIPISLALGLCMGWISMCAGLFLLWEENWDYPTSLYFFCISLLTIGLGDVNIGHPRALIAMFWMMIIGLCIVSMLLSVIQIKMEEWLYNFMVRMKKKYQEGLAEGGLDADEIRRKVMEEQPWFMRQLAPALLTEKQNHQIEQQAETFERVTREMNNKNIQTEPGPTSTTMSKGAQACEAAESIACDVMTLVSPTPPPPPPRRDEATTQYSEQMFTASLAPPPPLPLLPVPALIAHDNDEDSISDAPSLPLDSESVNNYSGERRRSSGLDGFVSVCSTVAKDDYSSTNNNLRKGQRSAMLEMEVQTSRKEDVLKLARSCAANSDGSRTQSISSIATPRAKTAFPIEFSTQTDIAQFQIDEILLKLHSIQKQRDSVLKPLTGSASVGTGGGAKTLMERSTTASILEMMLDDAHKDDKSTQYDLDTTTALMDQAVLTDVLSVLHRSMEASPELCTQGIQCIGERRDSGTSTILPEMRTLGTMLDSGEYKKELLELVDSGTEISLRESLCPKCDAMTQSCVALRDAASSPPRPLSTLCRSTGTTPPPERHPMATQTNEEEMDKTSLPPLVSFSAPPSRKPTIVCEAACNADVVSRTTSTQVTPTLERRCGAIIHSPSPFAIDQQGKSAFGRTESNQSLAGSLIGEDRQEVVVQTDDSYLKIARRLDQYRSNRTQFLPVCAADPVIPGSSGSSPDRPTPSRGFYIDPFKDRRKSVRFSMRKKSTTAGSSAAVPPHLITLMIYYWLKRGAVEPCIERHPSPLAFRADALRSLYTLMNEVTPVPAFKTKRIG